ncbi:MAG: RNA polymerase sigma factor [bacterium]
MEKHDAFFDLLKRCEIKDREAWNNFTEKYGSYIYLYINKILSRYNVFPQNGEAEEVFNSVFSTLLDKDCKELKNFQGENEYSFWAFLREISFRVTLDFLKVKKSIIDQNKKRSCSQKRDHSLRLNKNDLPDILSNINEELHPRYQYLFRLIYEEGLGPSEVAEIMNINLNALGKLKSNMLKNIIKVSKKKGLYPELKLFLVNNPITMSYPLAKMA